MTHGAVAAIDLGTNSTRLLVVGADGGVAMVEIASSKIVTPIERCAVDSATRWRFLLNEVYFFHRDAAERLLARIDASRSPAP